MPGMVFASRSCESCAASKWCPEMSSAEKAPTVHACPAGTYSLDNETNLVLKSQCGYLPCPTGHWCDAGTIESRRLSTPCFKRLTGGTSFSGSIISIKSGNNYIDTRQVFHRPVDMSVKIKQNGGSSECGLVALFPQSLSRHSGYHAFVGEWANYFGAGVDESYVNMAITTAQQPVGTSYG